MEWLCLPALNCKERARRVSSPALRDLHSHNSPRTWRPSALLRGSSIPGCRPDRLWSNRLLRGGSDRRTVPCDIYTPSCGSGEDGSVYGIDYTCVRRMGGRNPTHGALNRCHNCCADCWGWQLVSEWLVRFSRYALPPPPLSRHRVSLLSM